MGWSGTKRHNPGRLVVMNGHQCRKLEQLAWTRGQLLMTLEDIQTSRNKAKVTESICTEWKHGSVERKLGGNTGRWHPAHEGKNYPSGKIHWYQAPKFHILQRNFKVLHDSPRSVGCALLTIIFLDHEIGMYVQMPTLAVHEVTPTCAPKNNAAL